MNEFEVDGLIDEVLGEMANPVESAGMAERCKTRSMAMGMTAHVAKMDNVLVFRSLGRQGGGMSKRSLTVAALLNLAALMLVTAQVRSMRNAAVDKADMMTLTDPVAPPALPPSPRAAGGGGGNPGTTAVTHGNPPKFAVQQINPVKTPPLQEPKIRIEPTVDVPTDLKMAKGDLPNFGVANSPLVGMSLGNGHGGGLGSGDGGGIGPGSRGGIGGGVHAVGGGVSAPVVLFQPEPEFSEEARRAKISGDVLVYLQVDESGRPSHVRVLRGIGAGLDERAIAAVQQYKFKPAMENGHPVRVEMNVIVDFHIL